MTGHAHMRGPPWESGDPDKLAAWHPKRTPLPPKLAQCIPPSEHSSVASARSPCNKPGSTVFPEPSNPGTGGGTPILLSDRSTAAAWDLGLVLDVGPSRGTEPVGLALTRVMWTRGHPARAGAGASVGVGAECGSSSVRACRTGHTDASLWDVTEEFWPVSTEGTRGLGKQTRWKSPTAAETLRGPWGPPGEGRVLCGWDG